MLIDGQVEGKTPFQRRIFDPTRTYALTIRKPGFERVERSLSATDQWVEEGQHQRTLTVTAQASAPAAAPASRPAPSPPPEPAAPPPGRRRPRPSPSARPTPSTSPRAGAQP